MSSSSSNNLKLVNTIIAMCKDDPKWPHLFYNLSYGVKWLEYPFTCETGETLMPDLVIVSREQNNCILFENKSGNNIENDQAERYKKVQPKDVVSKLFVDTVKGKEPTIDVTYLCFSESTSNIISQLKALSAIFPVLELAPKILQLVSNSFSVLKLTEKLTKGIVLDRDKIPMGYFPFDENSLNSEVAFLVMQTIVAFARQNKPHFTIEEITQDTIGSLWQHFGAPKRKNLKNKVSSILGKAQARELHEYLTLKGEYWSLAYSNPNSSSFPTKRFEALNKKCRAFAKRLRDEERAQGHQLLLALPD